MLRDITNVPANMRAYGGLSCTKVGITLDGVNYLIKYPGSLKGRNLKNVVLSYSNSSISEYIGSCIFSLFGLNTHVVELVMRNDKLCAMCKDFVESGRLVEFRELKATYEPGFINEEGDHTDGCGTDLDEILLTIRNHHILKRVPEFESFFWKMFIIDALIGNHDRNTGNFGILIDDNRISIAPVYDNGNCLNPTWDDARMRLVLADSNRLAAIAYKAYTCRFTSDGKEINPFQLICSGKYELCTNALSIIDTVSFESIEHTIESTDMLSSMQRSYYIEVLKARYYFLKYLSQVFYSKKLKWCRDNAPDALKNVSDSELLQYMQDAYTGFKY